MKLAAFGALPADLLAAVRGGAVTAHVSGSDSAVIFRDLPSGSDSAVIFRDLPSGRAWRVEWAAESAAPLTFRRSGSAAVSATVPRIAAVCAIDKSGGASNVIDKSGGASDVIDKSGGASNVIDKSGGASDVIDKSCGASDVIDKSCGASNVIDKSGGASNVIDKSGGASDAIDKSGGASNVIDKSGGASDVIDKSGGASDVIDKSGGASNVIDKSGGASDVIDKSGGASDVIDKSGGASDVIARHRALSASVAHFLAPAPRETRELTRAFASRSNAAELTAVIAALSTVNRRGQRELAAAGYALVDIDAFPLKSERLRVANLALPKVAHDKELVNRFAFHADRDVMLAACSRGIMAGLGSAKRARSASDDDEEEEEEDKPKDNNNNDDEQKRTQQQEQEQQQKQKQEEPQPAARFVSMEQSGIRWADGALRADLWTMPSAAKEAIDAQRRAGGESIIAPARITSAAQMETARERYAVLLREYDIVRGHLQRFEDITEAARRWVGESGARFAPELRKELREWFEKQEAPRKSLVVSHGILHKAVYEIKREIEDYINLREWGVYME